MMENVIGDHLCPICKLGKEHGVVTCENIMSHASKWSLKK